MAQNLGYKNVTEQTLNNAIGAGVQEAGALSNALKNATGASSQGGTIPWNPATLSSENGLSLVNNLTGNGSKPFMALLNTPGASVTADGHWVLVKGVDASGNILIHDPAGLKYTMTSGNFLTTWKSGSLVTLK